MAIGAPPVEWRRRCRGLTPRSIGGSSTRRGTANIFFTACVCLLSVRVMTQRQEHEAEVRALNGQMEELRGEIDRLNNRGWFGFGGGNGKKESGGDAAKPRSEPKARAAKPTKGGEKVLI